MNMNMNGVKQVNKCVYTEVKWNFELTIVIYSSQRHHYTFQFVIIINFGCSAGIIIAAATAVAVVFDINKISKYQRTTFQN